MSEPRPVPRSVKPRRLVHDFRPIISVDQESGSMMMERTGEIIPLSDLSQVMMTEPSSLLIIQHAAYALADLHKELEHFPRWQFRLTPVRRAVIGPRSSGRHTVRETIVAFMGFAPPEGTKKKGQYHYPLDPLLFAKRGINQLIPDDRPRLIRLMEWGQDVRAWCNSQGLKVSPTAGGLAGQLLRHPNFYPEPRRKVPKRVNAQARPHLPGNYYQLFTPEKIAQDAIYLDMQSAHHNCAAELTFPHADGLHPRGRWRVTDATFVTEPDRLPSWAKIGTRAYARALEGHGLFLLNLTVPKLAPTQFPPPYMTKPGTRLAWVYSNELPLIAALGGIINGVHAAWTSYQTDPGLNHYAQWALTETAVTPDRRKVWLKPTLLATYGVLAARPRPQEFAYRRCAGGEPRHYPVGPRHIRVMVRSTETDRELPTVNVIQRGMIEAECRLRVLMMARNLHEHKCKVLGLYADSIFVKADSPLPLLPHPWSVKTELHRLQFFNPTSFTSAELTKLPGIPDDGLARLRMIEHIRRLAKVPANE